MRETHSARDLLSDEQIGQWVREWRRDHGLSQYELAEVLHCDQPTICRLERGRRKLTAAEYIALQGWTA